MIAAKLKGRIEASPHKKLKAIKSTLCLKRQGVRVFFYDGREAVPLFHPQILAKRARSSAAAAGSGSVVSSKAPVRGSLCTEMLAL